MIINHNHKCLKRAKDEAEAESTQAGNEEPRLKNQWGVVFKLMSSTPTDNIPLRWKWRETSPSASWRDGFQPQTNSACRLNIITLCLDGTPMRTRRCWQNIALLPTAELWREACCTLCQISKLLTPNPVNPANHPNHERTTIKQKNIFIWFYIFLLICKYLNQRMFHIR